MDANEHIINGYDCRRDAGSCVFDPDLANRPVKFIEKYCEHVEGEVAGQPLVLPEWQRRIVRNLYGWTRPDGSRRYRQAWIFVPRKNSKTTLLAALALYGLTSDGEAGAQVLSIAAKKEQAALLYKIAAAMIGQSPELARRCKVYRAMKSIEYGKTNSIYKALASEGGSNHGQNPSLILSDEIHAMHDRELIDALQTGQGARRNPLIVHTTTADFWRPESPCNMLLDYACKVRDGIITDASFLPAIWAASKDDDWAAERTWAKANPNYGLSVRPEFLREQCERAKNEPSFLSEFLRLHLNVTTDSKTAWLLMDRYDACVQDFDPSTLKGQRCYAGMDLSATADLTALSLYFPATGHLLCWALIPEDAMHEREKRDRVPYSAWRRDGHVIATSGNVVDYQFLRSKVLELSKIYNIQGIAYDPWGAAGIAQQLQDTDGLNMVSFRQGFATMSPAAKAFETAVMSAQIILPRNPVLRWAASNCMVERDAHDNIKPSKQFSTGRIDPIVATVMAVGLAGQNPMMGGSVYERRGPIVF